MPGCSSKKTKTTFPSYGVYYVPLPLLLLATCEMLYCIIFKSSLLFPRVLLLSRVLVSFVSAFLEGRHVKIGKAGGNRCESCQIAIIRRCD